MDDKSVRLEVLRIAADNCATNDSLAMLAHARVFESYVNGPLAPELEKPARKRGRPPGKKAT